MIVGDGEMPVEPGIIDDSIMLPLMAYEDSWPAYIFDKKYSTIDSASIAGNCAIDLVADASLKFSKRKLR